MRRPSRKSVIASVKWVMVACLAMALAACGPAGVVAPAATVAPTGRSLVPSSTAGASPAVSIAPTVAPAVSAPATCHSLNGLPDPVCTPGVVDPRVTQANIAITICVTGYTTTVRPAATYTNSLKIDQMRAYGLAEAAPGDYEEDHLIALEIGGDPRDPKNLWPQPRTGSANSANKDALENTLHIEVCAGTRTLVEAQSCIVIDWIACAALDLSRTVPTRTAAPATVAPTAASTSPAVAAPPATAAPPAAIFALTITASRYGFVSANAGVAGASCTARAKLPSGNFSTAQGLAPTKTSDGAGAVSWSYTTVSTTKPGTGTDTVTCTWSATTLSASAPFTVP